MGSLEKQIAALAAVNGADFCGFADMRRAIEMVERVRGVRFLAQAPISFRSQRYQ